VSSRRSAAAQTDLPTRRHRLSYRWELLLWLWLAFFFNQADRQVFNVVLPAIRTELGLSYVKLGLIASVFTAALAIMAPIAGFLGDMRSRKRIVVFALFGWSVATLCTGFGTGFLFLVVVRGVATAVGEGLFAPSAFAMLSAEHVDTRARAMSIFQTAVYAGLIGSGWIGGFIAERLGWRSAFWLFGASGIVIALGAALRLRDRAPAGSARRTSIPETVVAIVSTPTARLAALGSGALIFVNIGYLAWMPTYIYEHFGVSLVKAGVTSMLFHHVFAFAGVLLGGWLSDGLAPHRPQVRLEIQGLALLAGAPFIFWLGTASSLVALYVALGAFGFFRGVFDSNTYPAFFAVIPSRYHASSSGLLIAFAFTIASLSPVLLGEARETVGLARGFSALAFVYLLGAACALWGAWRYFLADWRRANGGGAAAPEVATP
jgi:MFS family permease